MDIFTIFTRMSDLQLGQDVFYSQPNLINNIKGKISEMRGATLGDKAITITLDKPNLTGNTIIEIPKNEIIRGWYCSQGTETVKDSAKTTVEDLRFTIAEILEAAQKSGGSNCKEILAYL